jgi:hypothetical protein
MIFTKITKNTKITKITNSQKNKIRNRNHKYINYTEIQKNTILNNLIKRGRAAEIKTTESRLCFNHRRRTNGSTTDKRRKKAIKHGLRPPWSAKTLQSRPSGHKKEEKEDNSYCP